jgi:tagatose 1,6-diphosphate aldolase
MNLDPLCYKKRILMLALDHRGSIAKMLPDSISQDKKDETVVGIKQMLISALEKYFSAVLIDTHYGLKAYQNLYKNRPNGEKKPFLLCIEKTGYTDTNHERLTQLENSVSQLKLMGAQGIKLLLFFHPSAKTAIKQIELTKKVYKDCQKNNLPFFLEILNYSLDEKPYNPSVLVPQSVELFLKNGITADVFKLEFPGNESACKKVTKLLGKTPWILLTKGETYEKFTAGLKIAVSCGACGFLAGRSIWQDFNTLSPEKWETFFNTTVKKRFEEISQIVLTCD